MAIGLALRAAPLQDRAAFKAGFLAVTTPDGWRFSGPSAHDREPEAYAAWLEQGRPEATVDPEVLAALHAAPAPTALGAMLGVVPQATESLSREQVQSLAKAVVNCHMLARRALASTGTDHREKWEAVFRLCENAGARSPGVLRASLPTEITDGSPASPPAPPASAYVCLSCMVQIPVTDVWQEREPDKTSPTYTHHTQGGHPVARIDRWEGVDLTAAERIRELRAELESAVDRESARVVERQHAMTTAQHYAHLVALVRELQASFNKEWERAPSGDFDHPANVRHAKAENDLFAWTPPAAPPVPETTLRRSTEGTCHGQRRASAPVTSEGEKSKPESSPADEASPVAPPVPEGEGEMPKIRVGDVVIVEHGDTFTVEDFAGDWWLIDEDGTRHARRHVTAIYRDLFWRRDPLRSPEAAPPERPAQDETTGGRA